MSVEKRDPHTGYMTTGHVWNGIEELNTPVPKAAYIFLGLAFVFAVIYWLLMPAFPLGVTYTKGLLGVSQHSLIDADLKAAQMDKAAWDEKILSLSVDEIRADAGLMQTLLETAQPIFGDNCAGCHGLGGKGGPGFPNLADGSWLWGGDAESVLEVLRVGVNTDHDDTHVSQMMAFGRDGMLDRAAIFNVVTYVQSLSQPDLGKPADVEAGRQVFAENCVSCHGETGQGNTDMGAPNLADTFWLYGGDRQSIYETVYNGRTGYMPNWDTRLSEVDRKILATYVISLGDEAQ
jgi:cytochrome c oxidase cbb3-type subunit 3